MFIVYNCGYRRRLILLGEITGKQYVFIKKFVTEVDREDGKEFVKMTSRDISWCPSDSRKLLPFMELEDWCEAKQGREGNQKYNPQEYLKKFLLKE